MADNIGPALVELGNKVDKILTILNGNGKIGLCAQVEINQQDIKYIKRRPGTVKDWMVAIAVILNTVVVVYGIFKLGVN